MQRIIGGTVAKKDSLPWMVSLEEEDGTYFCGGSILGTRSASPGVPTTISVNVKDHNRLTFN